MNHPLAQALIGSFFVVALIAQTASADEPQTAGLSVAVTGLGTVVSEPPGISCPGSCNATFPAFSDVKLRARPDKGQRLLSWAGHCFSPTKSCRLYMDGEKIVEVAFSADL